MKEFILSLINSFAPYVDSLAWPIAVIWILNIYKEPFSKLILLIKKAKYKDFHIDFEKGVEELSKEGDKILLEHPKKSKDQNPKSEVRSTEYYSKLADVSPRSAIMEAWLEVETAAADVMMRKSLPTKIYPMATSQMLNEINKAGLIDDDLLKFSRSANSLRNQAAHDYEFLAKENSVDIYIDLILSLAEVLRKIK